MIGGDLYTLKRCDVGKDEHRTVDWYIREAETDLHSGAPRKLAESIGQPLGEFPHAIAHEIVKAALDEDNAPYELEQACDAIRLAERERPCDPIVLDVNGRL